MASSELASRYQNYLDVLNRGDFSALDRHVHDVVVYNDVRMTRQRYADLLDVNLRVAPDLRYQADLVVAHGDLVAARLWFDVMSPGRIFDAEPTGRRVTFAEHVFYRYRDGRVAQVWSMYDRAALDAQLTAGPS